jgi:hypothetical protein
VGGWFAAPGMSVLAPPLVLWVIRRASPKSWTNKGWFQRGVFGVIVLGGQGVQSGRGWVGMAWRSVCVMT